jgi:hypothetical protein
MPAAGARLTERFLCRPLASARLDSASRLVYVPGAGGVQVLEDGFIALAQRLSTWKTFDEHLAALNESGHSLGRRELSSALAQLESAGILWTEREFRAALPSRAVPTEPIRSLVWPTRDRPHVLERSLASFLSNSAPPVGCRLLVCDDSTDPGAARANEATLLEAAGKQGGAALQAWYVGRAQKQRLVDALAERGARRGISPEAVRFLLQVEPRLPMSEGANRNFALLLTAGELFLSTDDDTLSTAAWGRQPGDLAVSADFNPTVSDLFEDDAGCLSAAPDRPVNMVDVHGAWVGRPIGDLIRERGSAVALDSCTASLSRDLCAVEGYVAITAAGALGDSGMANPRLLFHLDGPRRERYVEDESAYERLRRSRIVFRRAERAVVTNSPWLITMNHGVDNREPIPPTFPFGRNSDGLLGALLRTCHPAAHILHLPVAVRHLPPTPRPFTGSDISSFVPRICDFMMESIHAARPGAMVRSPADRIGILGRGLRALGDLPSGEFRDAVRTTWMSFADRYVSHLDARLQAYGRSPAPWGNDAEQYIENLLAFVRSDATAVPVEVAAYAGAAEEPGALLNRFRGFINLFGHALESWPILREVFLGLEPGQWR